MTIYATVNNVTGMDATSTSDPIWTLISPSGILQGGNPYFVPDFAECFEARTAIALRIGKLGKGIAPRFVHRYVEAIAPAVVFVAADRLQQLRSGGLPWTSALSYDRCLALGKFTSMEYDDILRCGCSLTLHSGDDTVGNVEFTPEKSAPSLEETVSSISRDNTLKTGDILLLGVAGSGPKVSPGMRARLRLNGEPSLSFNIR